MFNIKYLCVYILNSNISEYTLTLKLYMYENCANTFFNGKIRITSKQCS